MPAVTLGVVIGLVIIGLVVFGLVVIGLVAAHRRGHGDRPARSSGPVDGSALGEVPGYMPGMRRKLEPHDATAAELVLPPQERGIDLDTGEVRVRRSR